MRTQLRHALRTLVLLVVTLGSIPVAFAFVDGLAEARLIGIPLPWLVLGVGAYPLLILLGWLYVRRAERSETAFARLVTSEADDR